MLDSSFFCQACGGCNHVQAASCQFCRRPLHSRSFSSRQRSGIWMLISGGALFLIGLLSIVLMIIWVGGWYDTEGGGFMLMTGCFIVAPLCLIGVVLGILGVVNLSVRS